MLLLAAPLALLPQANIDPLRLPIGRPGEVRIELEQVVDTATGRAVDVDEIARAADRKRFVYLGESHATTPHQIFQASLIEALARRGRKVVIGLEMYTRPKQAFLDQWSSGQLSESEFLANSDWKGQWGFDFSFYRPVFEVARRRNLPMVALNVPRDWVRTVGRQGYEGLTAEQRAELPADLYVGSEAHRKVFEALIGGHPVTGPSGDRMYAAQVLWDEGMADTALKYLEKNRDRNTVFVVIAGSGHVMYDQGINYRIQRRKGGDGLTVVMAEAAEPLTVSRGLADYVFVSGKRPEK